MSRSAEDFWEFQMPVVVEGLTVQEVVDLITANRRERYMYDGNGSGCLSWCTQLLYDYVNAGYVDTNQPGEFEDFVNDLRTTKGGTYWIPEDRGTFL